MDIVLFSLPTQSCVFTTQIMSIVIISTFSASSYSTKQLSRLSLFLSGDGKCVICDSYVRPCTLVRICDECNYGSYQGRCVICGGPGVSDAYYCKECTIQEKDVSTVLEYVWLRPCLWDFCQCLLLDEITSPASLRWQCLGAFLSHSSFCFLCSETDVLRL